MNRRKGRAIDGVLLLDKPTGMTSNAALSAVKRLYNPRKAGHTGTLDPFASGMLPICLGEATKFSRFLLDADKTYVAELTLGSATATGDPDGEVVETTAVPGDWRERLPEVLSSLIGPQMQTPPMYSAIKVEGKRLYELARAGQTVERAARNINISELVLLSTTDTSITYRVRCSKGTYVRVLSEDIARAIGTLGFTSALRRITSGPFQGDMLEIPKLDSLSPEQRDMQVLPPDCCVASLPRIELCEGQAKALARGQRPRESGPDASAMRAYCGERFLGVIKRDNGVLSTVRLIRTDNS